MNKIFIILAIFLVSCSYLPWAELEEPELDLSEKLEEIEPVEEAPAEVVGCGDGICDIDENRCTCPEDCGSCSARSFDGVEYKCIDGKCKTSAIIPSKNPCGDGICELGETKTCPRDCPECDDSDECTDDYYDVSKKKCIYEPKTTCCGNDVCEPLETNACLKDCGAKFDLTDYPVPFIENGTFQTTIIVGSNASSNLIVAGVEVVRGLSYQRVASGYSIKAKLDNEISSIEDRNAILIGNACENTHVRDLMPYEFDCREGLRKDKGLIKLFKTGKRTYAIVIAGYGSQDVRDAAEYVRDWNETVLYGYEVWV